MIGKKWSRGIAIMLTLIMTFTMTTTIGFADITPPPEQDGDEVNLVVLGNETSSGFGLADFVNASDGFASNNNYLEEWAAQADSYAQDWTDETAWTVKAAEDYNGANENAPLGRMSNMAYPWKLKQYIAGQEDVSKVNLTPICMNGMRTDELRALLDEDYYKKASDREYAYAKQWIEDHELEGSNAEIEKYKGLLNTNIDNYIRDFHRSGVTSRETYRAASSYVKDSIENADVIVVDLCSANLESYLGKRISAMVEMNSACAPNTYETICDLVDLPPLLGKSIDSVMGKATSGITKKKTPIARQMLDALAYSTADCIVNYKAEMNWIIKHKKPGAKVIAVSVNNPMQGLMLDYKGTKINLGKIAGGMYSLINTHIRTIGSSSPDYYYAGVVSNMETVVSSINYWESYEALQEHGDYAMETLFRGLINTLDPNETSYDSYDAVKGPMQEMLFEGVHDHNTIYVEGLEKAAKEPDDAKAAIAGYLLSRLAGSTDAELDEGYWGLLNLAERFMIQGGVANFPDAVGCEQKSAAVNAAYESEDPAARAAIKAIKADLDEAAAMLKDKTALEHVVDITELLTQARAAFDTIGQTAQSDTVKQLKEKYNTLLNETVALLETSAADLMSRAMNLTDTSQVGWLLDSMDDLQALINALPAGTADKEQLQSLLTQARGILEQQSLGMTEDLLEQITAIYEQLQNTESIPKIKSLIDDLIAIGTHLVEVADAVYNLPEYEEAMDTFKLTTEYSMGLLEARVAELEYQTAQLTAKSIDVSASAKVTFPKNKAKLTISWATDADATGGYKVLFNGKEVTPAESEGVMTYEVNNVEIGKTYEYAITPSYQDAKTGKLYEGKTFKGTVVPKVTVKKTSIRKLTKGKRSFTVTWKKVSGATGYQIYYKTGKAKAVTKNVGTKSLSKKIKGLKKGKVYTVKVRALKTVNGKKYYGAWSAAKKVRTK